MNTIAELRSGKLDGATRVKLSEGLTQFPPELRALADSLEILDLSGNQCSQVPDWLIEFPRLRILFLSQNRFANYPNTLGRCANLEMVGFKANRISQIGDAALGPKLRWLILTDNAITRLPETIGDCPSLQKVMLAGNQLNALPQSMQRCARIELLRISANRFTEIPKLLTNLPELAWLAIAGNPIPGLRSGDLLAAPQVDWKELTVQEKLGEGASGITYRAERGGPNPQREGVAVKIFFNTITSDGHQQDEMLASLVAGSHPRLVTAQAVLANHPEQRRGVILPLIPPEFAPLAGPPSFESCTRDVYRTEQRFTTSVAERILDEVTEAAAVLHSRGILHGDLYAHNILVNATGEALLGDLGAASCWRDRQQLEDAGLIEIEQRALAHLRQELRSRVVQ